MNAIEPDYYVRTIGHDVHCFTKEDALECYRSMRPVYDDICLEEVRCTPHYLTRTIRNKGTYFKK